MDWYWHNKLILVRLPYSGDDFNGWFQESWRHDMKALAIRICQVINPTDDDRIAVVSSTAANSFTPAGLLGEALQYNRHHAYIEDALPELREKYHGGNAGSAFKRLMQFHQGTVIVLSDIGMVEALTKIALRGERTRIPQWDGYYCSGYVLVRNNKDERPVVRTISLEDLV